jgi:hypothetical protein
MNPDEVSLHNRVAVSGAASADARLLSRLFAPAQRWGFEYRAPHIQPFARPHVPVLQPPVSRRAAVAVSARENLSPRASVVVAALLTAGGLALAHWGAAWDAQVAASRTTPGGPPGSSWLHLAQWPPYLFGLAVYFVVRAVVVGLAARHFMRRFIARAVSAQRYYAEQRVTWSAARQEVQERAKLREDGQTQWFAIRPGLARRLDVFGGTPAGWEAFLVTTCTSLLGTDEDVSVVDLSGDDVARALLRAAQARGLDSHETVLGDGSAFADVLAGLEGVEVADLLMETLHGPGAPHDHEQRSLDRRLLGEVIAALDAPLTIARICAGLRVLLRQEPPPGSSGCGLGEEEYDRVAALFTGSYLQHAAQRVTVLESMLHPLSTRDGTPQHPPIGGFYARQCRLQVVRTTEGVSKLSAELMAYFVLQLLLRAMGPVAKSTAGRKDRDRTVVVAACDELRDSHLEQLAQVARRRGVRLVLLFRHLRDDAIKLVGGSDATYFMRLGNTAEAAQAAEYIGRDHKFVINQTSLSSTEGTNSGTSIGFSRTVGRAAGGSSRSVGDSRTVSSGTSSSVSDSVSRQRVYEFVVEPTALQSLPENLFIFIDPSRRGPRARIGSCDPMLLALPITQDRPVEDPAP